MLAWRAFKAGQMTPIEADNPAPTIRRAVIITALGLAQILSWGTSFYFLAVFANPIARETGWPYAWVVAGVSLGLVTAGFISPRVGREIGQRGGRPVLAGGAMLFAAGLALIGASQNLSWYFAAWVVLGAGMGIGLYDGAFATLGAIYRKDARGAIAAVTLFGGFASTVCWPLSALLIEQFGWRGACFVYAAIHLGIAAPVFLLALPKSVPAASSNAADRNTRVRLEKLETPAFVLLASVVTIGASILALMGTHLLHLLESRGISTASAVLFGMLIGPSAVGARMIESFAGRHYHPFWTMAASVGMVAAGAFLLTRDIQWAAPAIVLYAAGNGIGTIARGSVPLALFGPSRYPALMGRLGLPIMLAMAAAPFIGAWAFEVGGSAWMIAILNGLAFLNVALVAGLWLSSRALRQRGA